ncbi:ectonucleoside triphosphate diphosphohydrolase 5 isoform X2 [Bemisia tabaci]|uniref:ectonucleoside triphosphate diphosphohydrolase 5 isoform X2 n=1 Tax=Bemisia tabaci TaxID=7038 RepID=UPI0008F984AD|nr:PREDICTED: ectonucleoside triphosphate diphosphohydrolase 5 isoform X2 [Bemisia tabaci]
MSELNEKIPCVSENGGGDESQSKDSMIPKRKKKLCSRTQTCFLYIILAFVCSSFYYYQIFKPSPQTNFFDSLAFKVGLHVDQYAVIIDAGSTGSRLLALEFRKSLYDGNIKIERELFLQGAPSLSSFQDSPKGAADSITKLVNQALDFVPERKWTETPIALRATAGLRLLPLEKSSALLQEVAVALKDCPFLSTSNSVAIMDGRDEGLFSWFTVNFLMGKLGGSVEDTVGALDLGGGSTQITFAPLDDSRIKRDSPQYLHSVKLMQQEVNIYTHSYLGLGLMAARQEILTYDSSPESTSIFSKCVNPVIKDKKWKYGNVEYLVSGYYNAKASVNYSECHAIVQKVVSKYKVDKPLELLQHDIVAFSYYFDRATEVGLVDPYQGGTIKLTDYFKSALEACKFPNAEQPFMCLDLTYISVLLHDGFGLDTSRSIRLIKKIDDHEISWALGAAFHILRTGL